MFAFSTDFPVSALSNREKGEFWQLLQTELQERRVLFLPQESAFNHL